MRCWWVLQLPPARSSPVAADDFVFLEVCYLPSSLFRIGDGTLVKGISPGSLQIGMPGLIFRFTGGFHGYGTPIYLFSSSWFALGVHRPDHEWDHFPTYSACRRSRCQYEGRSNGYPDGGSCNNSGPCKNPLDRAASGATSRMCPASLSRSV